MSEVEDGAKRLAFYLPSLRLGGAERVTVTIANYLADAGYDIDLVVSTYDGNFRDAVSSSITIVDLDPPSVPGVGVLTSIPALARYIRQNRPQMLISALTHANIVAAVSATLSNSGTTMVVTEHNTFGHQSGFKNNAAVALAKIVYSLADRVITVSEGARQSYVQNTPLDPEDVVTLYNPVDVNDVRRTAREGVDEPWLRDDDVEVVLTVGRLESQKQQNMLLRAFARCAERRPRARLIIVGKGSRRAELEALAKQLGIDDRVKFTGFVDNAYAYMRTADVFVLSSRNEGLPTVLIEALACGCPIVSTDCPSGPREILADGEYGRLTPVGDPDALAEAIVATLESPPDAEALTRRADDFAPEVVMDEYVQFIESYLSVQ